ncbi:unnamed protein product [Penicillium egyptiacum]|uniref:ATP-dependent DNA helicase II subunit 2 n=1 Tax=Penicillium egyptiacum TaxID=1303716 RepID=A0A9W4P1L4_9EURO|nr:unnamed protein product [Penicillium egyptiacum]
MAEKEATVYIVDMGRSMGEHHHGRPMTDLEWAMQYVWDRITATVATGRKTATVGVVGLRTDVLMPDIRRLRETIKPSNTNRGDAISSIVIAVQMIIEYTKKNKYKRKIVLVTNGTGAMSDDNIEGIIEKIKEIDIELVVMYVSCRRDSTFMLILCSGADFDDAEYGVKEEDKDSRKAENETLLRTLTEDCEGVYGTLEQAVSELDIPRIKVTRSMPSFKGNLTLGNPEEYDTAITIPVERYFRTYVAKPISASSFVPRSGTEPGSQAPVKGNVEGDALTSVRTSRTYQVTDESAPGGKIDVEREDLAKGYEYGRTAVPIEQTDENIANLQTFAGMGLIGFVQKDQYDRYMHMSNTNIIIPQRANDNASLALSSLIHALYELESYAVARLVTKESKPPMLVLLAPSVEADYECLLEVQLPFAEDVRSYRFPPLDRIVTVSGKVVTEHRNLPSADLKDAMSNYVDSMEFITTNDEGERTDDLPIDESFSPLLHRIESAVRYRAVHPHDPVLDPSERLTQFAHPSEDMVKNSKSRLGKLISTADVKKGNPFPNYIQKKFLLTNAFRFIVPPKTKGRKRQRETEKPLSGLDVDALLSLEPKRTKISTENAIPEFKQTLARAENIDAIHDAVQQMAKIIETQITHSLGHSNYDRVIEGLGTMREELVDYEEPALYNDFVRQLKGKMLREELGGDRRELWWFVRKGKLGLIGKSEVDSSAVEEEEAQEFLAAN